MFTTSASLSGGEWLDWLLSVHLSPGRPTIGRYHHHITQRHTQPNKDGLLKTQSHNSDNNTIQNRESFSKCIGLGVRRTIPTLEHMYINTTPKAKKK